LQNQEKKRPISAFQDEDEENEPARKRLRADVQDTDSKQKDQSHNLIEIGHIYFFYRPRVEVSKVEGIEDVQRFFFIMKPMDDKIKNKLVRICSLMFNKFR
jgi:hypothetical protein